MRLLLDTSVLIDHLRDDPRAIDLLGTATERADELWGSVVTRAEVLRGTRPSERTGTMLLLDTLAWVEVLIDVADRAGEMARTYRASHPGIDIADFLIAASAEKVGARLVTRNVKHFPMIPDLEPAYGSSAG